MIVLSFIVSNVILSNRLLLIHFIVLFIIFNWNVFLVTWHAIGLISVAINVILLFCLNLLDNNLAKYVINNPLPLPISIILLLLFTLLLLWRKFKKKLNLDINYP